MKVTIVPVSALSQATLAMLVAADRVSALADSVTNFLGSANATWTIVGSKLNLIFLVAFALTAITNTRGSLKWLRQFIIFALVAFGIAALPDQLFVFADGFGKAFLLVTCFVGVVAWPILCARLADRRGKINVKLALILYAFEGVYLLLNLNSTQ